VALAESVEAVTEPFGARDGGYFGEEVAADEPRIAVTLSPSGL
jgi:hypothetical protein